MRVAVGVLGAEPDDLEQLPHPRACASRPRCRCWWIANGSPTICSTVLRGLSDAYGSWKIICISRRSGRSCPRRAPVMSRPSKRIVPAVGSSSRRIEPRSRRLAAARLADDPERLALVAPSASRPRPRGRGAVPAREDALLDREVLRRRPRARRAGRARLRAHPAAPEPRGVDSQPRLCALALRARGWQRSRWPPGTGVVRRRARLVHGAKRYGAARMERAAARTARSATAASPRSATSVSSRCARSSASS